MEECVLRTWMPQLPAKVNRGITPEQEKGKVQNITWSFFYGS